LEKLLKTAESEKALERQKGALEKLLKAEE
jgi:hypothetical protein